MKKKILTLFLLIALLCALPTEVAFATPAAKPTIQSAIDKVLEKYPHDSYFSKNGQQCNEPGEPHNTSNCYSYRLYNHCVGFARYATSVMYGKDVARYSGENGKNVGYNFRWGNTVYFDKIGAARVTDSTAVETLLGKAKIGDVVEVIRESPSYSHAMIFLSHSGGTSLTVYHANWKQNCNIAYNDSVNFTTDKYKGATMTLYHAKNYEYLYGADSMGAGGPADEPIIKLDSKIVIASVDKPLRTSVGVRMYIENYSNLYLNSYGLQYRKSGSSGAFKTVKTVSLDTYGVSRGLSGTYLFIRADGLAEGASYEFRAVLDTDGQTLYSGTTKPYTTEHVHKYNSAGKCTLCGEYKPANPDMIIGTTQTLNANAANESVTWSSSNTKVAKVDKNGKVTAVGAGKVTIKAVTKDGGKKLASYALTVHQYVTMQMGKTTAIQNGKKTSIDAAGTKPFKISGKTMLPLRFVGEKMGGKVNYISDSKPITMSYGGTKVEFRLGDKKMKVITGSTTKTIMLDVPAQKVGGKTFIPLRAIGQALGFDIYYEAGTEYIVVNNPKMTSAVKNARLSEAKKVIK